MPLKRFVAGGVTYDFTAADVILENYKDNFAELATRTKRLPGAHGGFDQLGSGRALSEIGTVRQQIHLISDTREGMQVKRDTLKKMAEWGVGVLYMQPTDPALTERFCRARIDDITTPEMIHMYTELHQPATIVWQVADPFWCTPGNGIVWGQGASVKWGDGTSKWGGGSGTTVTGSNTFTLANSGNAFILPTISIRPAAGKQATDPLIRRFVNGSIVDEIRYLGTITALQCLSIDCRGLKVFLDGISAYTSNFGAKNGSWLRLLPGDNSVEVRFTYSTDEAVVRFQYPYRFT